MSNAFVIIKMCYVHNQWYGISCATLSEGENNPFLEYDKMSLLIFQCVEEEDESESEEKS